MSKGALFIFEGAEIGQMTVVGMADRDDLPVTVPLSYRGQGSIWACLCKCGEVAYYPEKLLSQGSIKSCGCLRRSMLKGKKADAKIKAEVTILRNRIAHLQSELRHHQIRGTIAQYQDDIGAGLRAAFARLKELGFTR